MNRLSQNIQKSIKSNIEKTVCPIHREHPIVSFTQQGFSVSCCCEKFRKETISKCEKIIGDALHEQIVKSLKG